MFQSFCKDVCTVTMKMNPGAQILFTGAPTVFCNDSFFKQIVFILLNLLFEFLITCLIKIPLLHKF